MAKTKSTDLLKEMEIQNLDPKEWVLLEEAANRSVYSKRQIKKLAEKGIERIGTIKINNTILYNIKHISQYAANHQKKPILSPVWDEIEPIEGEIFYPLYGYDNKYFVTNKLRVIDCSNGQVLTTHPKFDKNGKDTGYRQVTLRKNGKDKNEILHRLVGLTQCPNALGNNIFHHIKICFPSDDRASNLLPVANKDIHDKLHKLLREGNKEEYKKMVAEIKRENRQKVYKIPDLDFESDEHFNYWMLINEAGYKEYIKCGDVSLDCILQQIAEVKE